MTKPRYYAHAFGSKKDGSLQHVVMDRESNGGFWHTAPSIQAASDLADSLNAEVCMPPIAPDAIGREIESAS